MTNILEISLETFNDLIHFVYSRLTTVSITASVFCSESLCFTIIGSDEQYFVIKSPPPSSNTCKFAYIDEKGEVKCSMAPAIGRPSVVVVRVKSLKEVKSFEESLKIR